MFLGVIHDADYWNKVLANFGELFIWEMRVAGLLLLIIVTQKNQYKVKKGI